MKRFILAAIATLGIGVGALALTSGEASATYYFPGLSVIDTQNSGPYSCDSLAQINTGNVTCYTWIRINGVLRRGSYIEYFSEAQGGYVLVACSAATAWNPIGSWNPPFGDFWGSPQSPIRWQWAQISNHPYCVNPVLGPGYNYSGYPWPVVANGNPQ